jgi:hypothetical protein
VPGVSASRFSDCQAAADGSIPSIRRVRSPVAGMNGRTSSAMTRTVSAATFSAVSSSGRLAASLASTHGSRVTM